MSAYKIIVGATQNRETGEITPIYREATKEQFVAWMRPILHAAGALRDAQDKREHRRAGVGEL